MATPIIYELGELAASEIIDDIAASELYTTAGDITDKAFKGYLGVTGAYTAAEFPFKLQDRGKRKFYTSKSTIKRRKGPGYYSIIKNDKFRRKKMAPRRPKRHTYVISAPKSYSYKKYGPYRSRKKIGKYGARHKSRSSNTIVERPIGGSMRMLQVTRTAFGTGALPTTDKPKHLRYNTWGSASGGFGYNFGLDQMGSHTDFTAIFQYYKIVQVELHFIPRQDSFPSLTAAATQVVRSNGNDSASNANYDAVSEAPYIIIACDNSTDAAFASESAAFAHEGSSIHYFTNGRSHTTRISPTVLRLAGNTGTASVAYNPKRMWISTADASEKHYGVRGWASGFHSGTSVDVILKYKVVFKDLKT